MTRPRNDHDQHPPWCTQEEFLESLTKHRSVEVRVGRCRAGHFTDRGEVRAKLTATYGGPVWLTVNVFTGMGVTAELSLEDAAVLRDGLTRLLQQAGHEPVGRQTQNTPTSEGDQ